MKDSLLLDGLSEHSWSDQDEGVPTRFERREGGRLVFACRNEEGKAEGRSRSHGRLYRAVSAHETSETLRNGETETYERGRGRGLGQKRSTKGKQDASNRSERTRTAVRSGYAVIDLREGLEETIHF